VQLNSSAENNTVLVEVELRYVTRRFNGCDGPWHRGLKISLAFGVEVNEVALWGSKLQIL
jgi:hypothetical protein